MWHASALGKEGGKLKDVSNDKERLYVGKRREKTAGKQRTGRDVYKFNEKERK